jgi:hypothetical protein
VPPIAPTAALLLALASYPVVTVTVIVSTSSYSMDFWRYLPVVVLLTAASRTHGQGDYGVDVSFPIHHLKVSENYAWLPHNVDPAHNPTPKQLVDVAVNPMPARQEMYDDFISSCEKAFGTKGSRCRSTEQDRIDMSLRQPQSMQVRCLHCIALCCSVSLYSYLCGVSLIATTIYVSMTAHVPYRIVELHRSWLQKDQGSRRGV